MIHRKALHAFRAFARPQARSSAGPTHLHTRFRFNSSTSSQQESRFSNSQRKTAFVIGTAFSGVAFGWWDDQYNDRTVTRNLRTAYHGVMIAVDYKLNFDPDSLESINALHERASNRLLTVCEKNR